VLKRFIQKLERPLLILLEEDFGFFGLPTVTNGYQ